MRLLKLISAIGILSIIDLKLLTDIQNEIELDRVEDILVSALVSAGLPSRLNGEIQEVVYFENGSPMWVYYKQHDRNFEFHLNEGGKLHGNHHSAYLEILDTDVILSEKYLIDGRLHRGNAPAVIMKRSNGTVSVEQFYENGLLHRLDKPAIIMMTLALFLL